MIFGLSRTVALSASIAALVAAPASAQMQLPGAFAPAPVGSVATPAAGPSTVKKAAKPVASAPKIFPDEGVTGRQLMLNGRSGSIEFRRNGKDLEVASLKLAGDLMSKGGEACEVSLSGSAIALSPAGRPQGVTRYRLELPACPFSVDILDGAVLAITDGKICEFRAADCRVDPAGLWGQPASEIGPQRAKDIEASRRAAEQTLRGNFKAWLATVSGDRKMVSRIAHEQAAFSSRREELCRTYARESQHGYCALVATTARSTAVAAHVLPPLDPALEEEPAPARKTGKKR